MMKVFAVVSLLFGVALAGTYDGVTFTDKEEAAVLKTANEASFETLHYTLDIYDYKATNIMAARTIETMSQLAAVNGVTEFVLNLFKTYVNKVCPPAGEQGGWYDAVEFTNDQAAAVLKMVNSMSFAQLRDEVRVYEYKVVRIFQARPICTMNQLKTIEGINYDVLRLLRDYSGSVPPTPTDSAKDCTATTDCAADEQCVGKPFDGSADVGKCRPKVAPAGTGSTCSASVPCGEGLVCAGVTLWGEGSCNPSWMAQSYTQKTPLTIAAGKNQQQVVVYGLATVAVDITLHVNLQHTAPDSLKITLMDPNGDLSPYWNGPESGGKAFPTSLVLQCCVPRDDSVNGAWKLLVENVSGEGSGQVVSWTLDLTSRWD